LPYIGIQVVRRETEGRESCLHAKHISSKHKLLSIANKCKTIISRAKRDEVGKRKRGREGGQPEATAKSKSITKSMNCGCTSISFGQFCYCNATDMYQLLSPFPIPFNSQQHLSCNTNIIIIIIIIILSIIMSFEILKYFLVMFAYWAIDCVALL